VLRVRVKEGALWATNSRSPVASLRAEIFKGTLWGSPVLRASRRVKGKVSAPRVTPPKSALALEEFRVSFPKGGDHGSRFRA
jgi:hypothetical protein